MAGTGTHQGTAVIPTGYDPASYACVRSLGRRGVKTLLASEHADVPATSSRYCDETVTIPPPEDCLLAYRDALLDLAARPEVLTIVPIRPEDTFVLSKFRDVFEAHVSLVTPPMETLRTVHDRVRLAEACEEAGVPVPQTRRLLDVDAWHEDQIVKSRYNVLVDEYVDRFEPGENGVVKDVTHVVSGEPPDVDVLLERMGHEPIVQEFVPFEAEYMFAGLYDHGEPVATFQHEQIRGNSYTGGGGVYRTSIHDPELEEVARRLLANLDYHGLACIEYMEHAETGEFYLTEINPRMWQSLPATVRAGADFPWYYWLLATGQGDQIERGYDLGRGSHLLYGELGHLASLWRDDSDLVERPSILRRAAEIVGSCVVEPRFDILRLDDPGPFLRGIAHVLPGFDSLRGPFSPGRSGEEPRVDPSSEAESSAEQDVGSSGGERNSGGVARQR